MGTITAANSVYLLSIGVGPGQNLLFPPIQLQGFATDAAFETGASDDAEVVIGVDGFVSAGYVPFLTDQTIHLQADSPSVTIFEAWIEAEKAALEKLQCSAFISLPSVSRKYALTTGFLKSIISIPGTKKVLQPRDFVIVWGNISPAPF